MSKIDRDIKDVLDDAFSQGEKLLKEILPLLLDENKAEDEKMTALSDALTKSKPKSYDDYINDLKLVFKQNGWTEPR